MTSKKKKQYSIDIFDVFAKINKENYDYFNHLTEQQMKDLHPYVIMRWMKGAQQNNQIHTLLTNQYMNPYVFTLQNHPVLLYKLAVAANGGIDEGRYSYAKKEQHKAPQKHIESIMIYYNCNEDEANGRYRLLSQDDLDEIGELAGYAKGKG